MADVDQRIREMIVILSKYIGDIASDEDVSQLLNQKLETNFIQFYRFQKLKWKNIPKV